MTYNEWNAKEVESGAHPTAWTGWCAGFEEGRHARDEEVKARDERIAELERAIEISFVRAGILIILNR
jgi:hypothetical protein